MTLPTGVKGLNKADLLDLLAGIAPGRGVAEHESNDTTVFLKNFLPVPNYRRVLEPDTLLVLGGRGVGKTELFRLLANEQGREALIETAQNKAFPGGERTHWVAAFGRTRQREKSFPTPEDVAQALGSTNELGWRAFWLGLLLGVVLSHPLPESAAAFQDVPAPLRTLLQRSLTQVSLWQPQVQQHLELINRLLDALDTSLARNDHWLFVTYDELDRLVPSYLGLAAPLRELLALWLDRWRRWDRIRPKIFLRTDLFREEFLGFPDASKLRAHQLRLEWQTPWLYRMLVKRLANAGSLMTSYLGSISGLLLREHSTLGWTVSDREELFEQLVEKLVGKYMGAGPTKGATYRWIPNHLQDAGGQIAPRSFLKLFALAAQGRLDRRPADALLDSALLHPSDLQGALMETSEDRIRELAQEEYPWLEALKSSLSGFEVPALGPSFTKLIGRTRWSTAQAEKRPPVQDPEAIIGYLAQLGIIERRPDGKINVPEIYLYGFGLKRRGGVKRPK